MDLFLQACDWSACLQGPELKQDQTVVLPLHFTSGNNRGSSLGLAKPCSVFLCFAADADAGSLWPCDRGKGRGEAEICHPLQHFQEIAASCCATLMPEFVTSMRAINWAR